MKRIKIGFCVLLLLAAFINTNCFAQGDEQPQQLLSFSSIQLKPGMSIEFEQFIKNNLVAIREMGVPSMTVFKTANFGMSDKYLFVFPLPDPAAMDAELSASEASIPVAFVSMISAIQRMVVSAHDFMVATRPNLNIPPKEGYEPKLLVYFTIGTAPGREEEFEKNAKVAIDALGRTDVKGILVGKVGLGGNLDEYVMSMLYDSFTDMMNNEPAIQKELAAADLTPLTGVVYYRNTEVLVRVPEISIQPAGQ